MLIWWGTYLGSYASHNCKLQWNLLNTIAVLRLKLLTSTSQSHRVLLTCSDPESLLNQYPTNAFTFDYLEHVLDLSYPTITFNPSWCSDYQSAETSVMVFSYNHFSRLICTWMNQALVTCCHTQAPLPMICVDRLYKVLDTQMMFSPLLAVCILGAAKYWPPTWDPNLHNTSWHPPKSFVFCIENCFIHVNDLQGSIKHWRWDQHAVPKHQQPSAILCCIISTKNEGIKASVVSWITSLTIVSLEAG
jgi:hypothetical protein